MTRAELLKKYRATLSVMERHKGESFPWENVYKFIQEIIADIEELEE